MKKILITALLMAGLTGIASANLLSNGGFDDGGQTYGDYVGGCDLTNWYGWGAAISYSDWGVAPQAGDHATMLSTWNEGGGGGVEQKPEVSVGTAYQFSGYYAIETAGYSGSATGFVGWIDASSTQISMEPFSVDLTGYTAGNWVHFEAFDSSGVTAPAGAVRAETQIAFTEGGATSYIDSFTFEAVPEPVSAGLLGMGLAFIYLLRKKIARQA
jgi:hypothetical protein